MEELSAGDLGSGTQPDSAEPTQPPPAEENQVEPQGFAAKFTALGDRIRSGDQAVGPEDFEALGEDLPLNAYERISQSVTPERLNEALSSLSDRERTIIRSLSEPQLNEDGEPTRVTEQELADQFGITKSRVQNIERTALRRLKNIIETT